MTDAHTRVASLSDLEEDDDEEDEESGDKTLPGQAKSLLTKIKNILNKGKKTSSDDEEDEEDEEGESAEDAAAAEKKKKIRLFVLAAIVVGVLFLIPDEEETVPAPEVPALKERPYKKDVKAQAPSETPAETPAETPTETPTETTPVEASPETPTETEAPATVEEPSTPDLTEGVETAAPVETNPEEPVEARPDPATVIPGESVSPDSFGEGTIPESPMETSGTDLESTIETTEPTETEPTETVGGEEPTIDESSSIGETTPDLTEQILQDLEDQEKIRKEKKAPVTTYVAPPPYQFSGRGLVYNCKGKHWACVDGGSYRICEDNFSGNQYLNKNTECYPFNVYQTEGGCEVMPKRMVTSSAKTNFCSA